MAWLRLIFPPAKKCWAGISSMGFVHTIVTKNHPLEWVIFLSLFESYFPLISITAAATFDGTATYSAGVMVKVPRPSVIERKVVA